MADLPDDVENLPVGYKCKYLASKKLLVPELLIERDACGEMSRGKAKRENRVSREMRYYFLENLEGKQSKAARNRWAFRRRIELGSERRVVWIRLSSADQLKLGEKPSVE